MKTHFLTEDILVFMQNKFLFRYSNSLEDILFYLNAYLNIEIIITYESGKDNYVYKNCIVKYKDKLYKITKAYKLMNNLPGPIRIRGYGFTFKQVEEKEKTITYYE